MFVVLGRCVRIASSGAPTSRWAACSSRRTASVCLGRCARTASSGAPTSRWTACSSRRTASVCLGRCARTAATAALMAGDYSVLNFVREEHDKRSEFFLDLVNCICVGFETLVCLCVCLFIICLIGWLLMRDVCSFWFCLLHFRLKFVFNIKFCFASPFRRLLFQLFMGLADF